MGDDFEDFDCDPSVGFLYKTMLMRDPNKRRVKPVPDHLLNLDFANLGDSSDDSDFQVPENKGSSDGDASDLTDDDDEGNNDDEEDDSGSENGKQAQENQDNDSSCEVSIAELIEKAKTKSTSKHTLTDHTNGSSGTNHDIKVHICNVCLGDVSEEEDEIVECDGCGVSVHEGCYGIGENQSIASTESSASTEPWFCDACKAGVKPHCELCPNMGGIYKETDAGKWVHIVCAMYIPGVAFGDIDKLCPVTLFEMPYTKWGSKECTLCEDDRFSRTGVCIGCDAGMCRTYFHVTCAQREGLLSEAAPDEEIADPFFAYCKQHATKGTARIKRRNWLAYQSNMKLVSENGKDKTRVQRKLNRHQQKYIISCAKRAPCWIPTDKMPRMLTTSASAIRRLMRKAELLGISSRATCQPSEKNIRKKWHVAPALSVEFVGYYLDRNDRMKAMKGHLRELLSIREKLQEQERNLRVQYDQISETVGGLKETNEELRSNTENIYSRLSAIIKKQVPLPEVLNRRRVKKSPTRLKNDPTPIFLPPSLIHSCGVCRANHSQHLLAKCDTCKLHYHLGCLDPPLTRMPKKSKLFGWQCSECDSSGSDESHDADVDTSAPRRLRENIKEPNKFIPALIKAKKKRKKLSKHSRKLARHPALKSPLHTSTIASTVTSPVTSTIRSPITNPFTNSVTNPVTSPVRTPKRKLVNSTHLSSRCKKKKTPKIRPRSTSLSPADVIILDTKPEINLDIKPMEECMPILLREESPVCRHPKGRPSRRVLRKTDNAIDKEGSCSTCSLPSSPTDAVQCDNCQQCYHFACLNPPCKKSPKQRGYGWICEECDSFTDEDLDDEEVDMKAQDAEKRVRKPSLLLQQMTESLQVQAAAQTRRPQRSKSHSPKAHSDTQSIPPGDDPTNSIGDPPAGDSKSPILLDDNIILGSPRLKISKMEIDDIDSSLQITNEKIHISPSDNKINSFIVKAEGTKYGLSKKKNALSPHRLLPPKKIKVKRSTVAENSCAKNFKNSEVLCTPNGTEGMPILKPEPSGQEYKKTNVCVSSVSLAKKSPNKTCPPGKLPAKSPGKPKLSPGTRISPKANQKF